MLVCLQVASVLCLRASRLVGREAPFTRRIFPARIRPTSTACSSPSLPPRMTSSRSLSPNSTSGRTPTTSRLRFKPPQRSHLYRAGEQRRERLPAPIKNVYKALKTPRNDFICNLCACLFIPSQCLLLRLLFSLFFIIRGSKIINAPRVTVGRKNVKPKVQS